MIDPSVLLALQTKNEIRIAVLLGASEEPLRKTDIMETLGIKKDACRETLERLVKREIITRFKKFGAILYEISALQCGENRPTVLEKPLNSAGKTALQGEENRPTPLVSGAISVQERNSKLKKEKGENY